VLRLSFVCLVVAFGVAACDGGGGGSSAVQADGALAAEAGIDSSVQQVCGDGKVQPGEQCDGQDLGGKTCVDLGYGGGQLSCLVDCTLYDGYCYWGYCGDGVRNGTEQCEGKDLGGKTCKDLGFLSGTLSCDGSCKLVTKACRSHICGDGKLQLGEQCDGQELGGNSCQKLGYKTGALSCTKACLLDKSGCVKFPCGNGKREGLEQCDGKDLGGKTCRSLGHYSEFPKLACNKTCTFDIKACGCDASYLAGRSRAKQNSAAVSKQDKGTSACGGALKLAVASRNPELAVGPKEAPHLLYAKNLLHVTRSGGKWVKTLLNKGKTTACRAMAVDTLGKVHIAVVDANGVVAYLTNSSGAWKKSVVFKDKARCRLSIATGPAGPAVAFSTHATPIKLMYSSMSVGKWSSEVVAQDTTHPTLMLDKAGAPAIAGWSSFGVSVASRTAGKWTGQAVDSATSEPMAAMDKKGALHLLYNTGSGITYATNATGNWVKTAMLSTGDATAFTVAPDGTAYVAYKSAPIAHAACGVTSCGPCGYQQISCSSRKNDIRTNATGAWTSHSAGQHDCKKRCRHYSPSKGNLYYWDKYQHTTVHALVSGDKALHAVSVTEGRYSSTGQSGSGHPHPWTQCTSNMDVEYRYEALCW